VHVFLLVFLYLIGYYYDIILIITIIIIIVRNLTVFHEHFCMTWIATNSNHTTHKAFLRNPSNQNGNCHFFLMLLLGLKYTGVVQQLNRS